MAKMVLQTRQAAQAAQDVDDIPGQEPLRPVRAARRIARAVVHCATCGQEIGVGERYREDRWRQPVFGAMLTSAICADCEADGL